MNREKGRWSEAYSKLISESRESGVLDQKYCKIGTFENCECCSTKSRTLLKKKLR